MECIFCGGDRITWRRPAGAAAYTYCRDCKRRNCEAQKSRLPIGENECDRAQLRLKI